MPMHCMHEYDTSNVDTTNKQKGIIRDQTDQREQRGKERLNPNQKEVGSYSSWVETCAICNPHVKYLPEMRMFCYQEVTKNSKDWSSETGYLRFAFRIFQDHFSNGKGMNLWGDLRCFWLVGWFLSIFPVPSNRAGKPVVTGGSPVDWGGWLVPATGRSLAQQMPGKPNTRSSKLRNPFQW